MSNLALITGYVEEARNGFLQVAIDKSISFEREAGFALQALTAQDFTLKTALSNPQSVRNAVTNISAIGLSLNPAKRQAYLVPRDGRICLDISYMGLLDLAIESGSIRWGQAELVYERDRFTLHGVDQKPTHEREPFSTDRGEIVGVYVVVKTSDGDYLTTTMTIAEAYGIRDRSSAWRNGQKGPWKTDPGEMIKKTVIKRAYKLWPKTEKLDRAIHHLNTENGEGLEAIENNEPIDQPANFGVTPVRAKAIRAAANAALQAFNEGNDWAAWEEVEGITDNEEKLALWSILKPHSALRASLKKSAAEARAREEAIDAMPAATEKAA